MGSGRGRFGDDDDGNDGGVYRYDYDDLDLRPTYSSSTPGLGRGRCVDANGVVVPCDSIDAIDDGLTNPVTNR